MPVLSSFAMHIEGVAGVGNNFCLTASLLAWSALRTAYVLTGRFQFTSGLESILPSFYLSVSGYDTRSRFDRPKAVPPGLIPPRAVSRPL